MSRSVITYSSASLTGVDSFAKRWMLNLFGRFGVAVSDITGARVRIDVILIGTRNGFTQL
jgi:hypothetical protein